jgi:hypothetical protein
LAKEAVAEELVDVVDDFNAANELKFLKAETYPPHMRGC